MDDYEMEDVFSACPGDDTKQHGLIGIDISIPPPQLSDIVQNGSSTLIVTTWDDQTSTPENIQAFLSRWPPSRTPSLYCNWIALDRGGHQHYLSDITGLITSFETLKSSQTVTVDHIDRIARAHGVLSGKWLIYAESQEIDELWSKIVQLVCLGLKKGSIKVSPKQEGEPHVICVYADDYTNTADVNALRDALRFVGVIWKIGFKPDAYTHLGIYAKNEWRIRPSRYFD